MNGAYQLIIETYRKEVDAKAFFPLDIGIGVGMLIQVAQHGEESILIPVEAAPRMKADIRLSVFLPGRDGKSFPISIFIVHLPIQYEQSIATQSCRLKLIPYSM